MGDEKISGTLGHWDKATHVLVSQDNVTWERGQSTLPPTVRHLCARRLAHDSLTHCMSRSWHPPRQRGLASGRTSQHMTSSRPISHPEDAQPNESVDKRQRCPPAVNIIQQSSRRVGQGSRRNTVAWGSSGSMRRAPPST